MNLEDDKIEPETDLGLSLGTSDRHNHREALNIDPSAGANAGSGIHMTFVATDPLTELVWSPHKGLSLKYAECSFSDRKQGFLWGAGPRNAAGAKCLSEPLNEPNSMELENKVAARIGFTTMPESSDKQRTGNGENALTMKMLAPAEVSSSHKSSDEEDLLEGQKRGDRGLVNMKMTETSQSKDLPSLSGCERGTRVDVAMSLLHSSDPLGNQKVGGEMVLASEVHLMDADKHSDAPPELSPCKEKGKRRMKKSSTSLPLLDKLESTAENNLQASKMGNICRVGIKITSESESAPVIRTEPILDCEGNVGDNIISNSCSPPSNSGAHKRESKGKGKALSEGDISGSLSKDEEKDDSYESVESCNSAGVFSTGKRRWSFEQQLIVGSKRIKQIEQSPGTSSSLKKHDSSFMNWISNMMKGFARPLTQDEDACQHGLDLANSKHVQENLDAMVDGEIRPHNRSIGFKSIFQSIYCPNKSVEGMSTCYNQLEGGPAEAKLPDQMGSNDSNMLTCLDKERESKVLRENSNGTLLGNEVAQFGPPQISSGNLVASRDIVIRARSSENRSLNYFEDGKSKYLAKTYESSLNEHNSKRGATDNSPQSEEKRANNLENKGDPLGSLWITRFSARGLYSLSKQEAGNVSNGGACESVQNSFDFCQDQAALEVRESSDREPAHARGDREQKNFGFSTEPSVGFRRVEDPILVHKVNQILPSPRVKSSEAMASVFARRLDALKNIISSSDLMDDLSGSTTTCFFCGIKGHHLQNCSEITEPELEDILRNIKSYDNAEGSPCFCIRCFQLNHWAVACPNASWKSNPKDNFKCNNLRLKDIPNGDGVVSRLHGIEKKSNENLIALSGDVEKWQVSEVPKGIFSAIKTLRLSRTDILKWMNSRISLSLLDGFFLRLRLGKWEEGLGGTGYHVACITDMQRKSFVKNAKSPISVNVGGIKCLVESRYISNHDFLEDELITWWCKASQNGVKIPSEEDLKMKAAEKKMLGF